MIDIGAVKFVDCNNVTIEGLNLEQCGSKDKPAIGVYNSSSVVFGNCSFLYSMGQAAVLSNTSGTVYFKNCHFAHNNKHRGHGAAIYYLSSTVQSMMVIDDNSFESNGPANSTVYIGALNNKYPRCNYLQNSTFVSNLGVPIYLSHTNLQLYGSVLFKGNEAENGGGIYSTSSTVIFDDKCNVSFCNNSAARSGGALYQINSEVFFKGNSKVMFTNNSAVNKYGGAIYSWTLSFISFTDDTMVVFINNFASLDAGAIFTSEFSNISFDENSKVHFNNNSAERYGGAMKLHDNTVISFGGSSIITFTNNRAEYGGAILWYESTASFSGESNITFDHNIGWDGGAMYCINSTTSFHENSSVKFYNNTAAGHGGAAYANYHSYVLFHGNSFASFTNNTASFGGAVVAHTNCRIAFDGASTTFTNNTADHAGALGVYGNSSILFMGNTTIIFKRNNATTGDGGAVSCNNHCNILFNGNSNITFSDNSARASGGAMKLDDNAAISFGDSSIATFNSNRADYGGAISWNESKTTALFSGESRVKFDHNIARRSGGALYCVVYSNISFHENSTVKFYNNRALEAGGAVQTRNYPNVMFYGQSYVSFINNTARHGGAIHSDTNSRLSFDNVSTTIFTENTADQQGGALVVYVNSKISFLGNSTIIFKKNKVTTHVGGAVCCNDHCNILLNGNSNVSFSANSAKTYGGAMRLDFNSLISFGGRSITTFNSNGAEYGGAIAWHRSTTALFSGESTVTFDHNTGRDGGAVYYTTNSAISFNESSTVKFYNNEATVYGGAVVNKDNSHVMFYGNSYVSFIDNTAECGGAIHSHNNSRVSFDDVSTTTFTQNAAYRNGGALNGFDNLNISFMGDSKIIFKMNKATTGEGGAVCCHLHCNIILNDNSNVTFSDNRAIKGEGGAVHTMDNSKLSIRGSSLVTFTKNNATYGGAVYFTHNSNLSFHENSIVKFYNNRALKRGGAVCNWPRDHSYIGFGGNTVVTFTNNTAARYGGAMSIDNSNVSFTEKSNVTIIKNSALYGGGMHASKMSITLEDYSVLILANNVATENGGALHLTDNIFTVFSYRSTIAFDSNIADRYGGALYAELPEEVNRTSINFTSAGIQFCNNSAPFGANIYVHVPSSCDDHCVNNSIIVGTTVTSCRQVEYISTSPNKLVLHEPAACVDDDNHINCDIYLIRNIVLGQEVVINGCVLDYYNRPAATTQFLISSTNKHHRIADSKYVQISCDSQQEIRVIGNEVKETKNFSMAIASYSLSQSGLETFSVQLTIELSPCHPGFHYDNKTQSCICHKDNNIITCIDGTSFIKESYWLGVVDGKTTVAICPNNYCNFTCCKTTSEFYQLSPERINQCLSHRSGTACGSCEEGYTLSFDSVECVRVSKCTTEQTVLIVTLSVIYWIVIVILVFIVTYYHAGIGYLYAITYYYSVVDILLSERLYVSTGLFTTVSIMSSIAKVTPQFLGQLCFVKHLSGIDQQFIHYAHPLAITIILILICLLARVSYRISAFVSRGIIHVICFLLLLSYTSVATTSLLLMRSLTFVNIDKIYTYLSPDIEYFHGRHLPYVITAILCTLVIVIGLPLLLLLEPFLNSKINFTKIKPILDQFQGCYKDKYRSFAAYYMICRLVIILIIIVNSSNDNTQYLLITVNVTLASIQVTFRPYSSTILNMFDGLILQLLIVISMIPLVGSFDPDLLLAFTIILVILPLIAFLIMEIYIYKSTIKKITEHFTRIPLKSDTTNDNNELPMRDFVDSVIDDNSRKNAYICEK